MKKNSISKTDCANHKKQEKERQKPIDVAAQQLQMQRTKDKKQ